jgi:hypothetical protein
MFRFKKKFDTVSYSSKLFIQSIISIIKVLLASKWNPQRLPKPAHDTCIVLGNGPSLKKTLQEKLNWLQQYDCVCVNSFSMSPYYGQIKPKYYIMLDHMFWMVNEHEPLFSDIRNAYHNMRHKTDWPMYLMLPRQAEKSDYVQRIIKSNRYIIPVFYNYTVFQGFDRIAYWFYDRQLAMPQSQNVLVAAIFQMIAAGYKKIILFGADHTWHRSLAVNDDNLVGFVHEHFYDGVRDHTFSPEYKSLITKEPFNMIEIFMAWMKTHYGHHRLKDYARWKKCEILNATPDSCIDAYKKVKL